MTESIPPKQRKRRRTSIHQPSTTKKWEVGAPTKWELLALVVLVVVSLASYFLEPGFSRPLRHAGTLISGLATVFASVYFARNKLSFFSLLTYAALTTWWFFCALSTLSTIDTFKSQESLVNWAGATGVFLLAASAFHSSFAWRAAVASQVACSLALCLTGLVQKASDQPFRATFTNQDTFCVVPMVSFFLAASLLNTPSKWQRVTAGASAVFFGSCILLTGSRSGAVGLVAGSVVFLAALGLQKNKDLLRKASSHTFFALLSIVCLGVLSGSLFSLFTRVEEATNGKDIQGVTMRHNVLVYGLATSREHPILGFGPGTFALAYQKNRPKGTVPEYIFVNYAHDDYIEMLVEIGLPGFLCWLLFSCLVLTRGVRLIRFSIAAWECSALIGGVISLGAFATLNFILPVPAVFALEMMTLGLLQGLPAGDNSQPSGTGQKLVALALAVAGCVTALASFRNLKSDLLVQSSKKMAEKLRWEDSKSELDKGLEWYPHNSEALLARGRMLAQQALFDKDPKLVKSAEKDLQLASFISPKNPEIMRTRIFFYSSAHKLSKAEELLEIAHEQAPYRDLYLTQLTRIRLMQGKLVGSARAMYEDAIEDEESRKVLPKVLLAIEEEQADAGIDLLSTWSNKEGDTSMSVTYAKQAAKLAVRANNLGAASRFVTFVQTKSPDDTEALYLQSLVYKGQGKERERKAILLKLSGLDKSMREDPNIDAAVVDLASSEGLHYWSPTFRALEKRLKRYPKSLPLRLAVARAYMKGGKLEMATEILSGGLDLTPDQPSLLLELARCLDQQGLTELSRNYYEQVLSVEPDNLEARKALAPSKKS